MKMCPRGCPRRQGRLQGLLLCKLIVTINKKAYFFLCYCKENKEFQNKIKNFVAVSEIICNVRDSKRWINLLLASAETLQIYGDVLLL